jgi:hypothetical protein
MLAVALSGSGCATGTADDYSGTDNDAGAPPRLDASVRRDAAPADAPSAADHATSAEDAAPSDVGGTDAVEPDARGTDAGEPDAGGTDAGEPDAREPDAGGADAGAPDAGVDAGEDAAVGVDAGEDAAVAVDAGVDAAPDATVPPVDSGSDTGSVACPEHGFTGALAIYDLASQPGAEASAQATSLAAGVTALPISRASTITPVSGAGSINGSGWTTAASPDAARYYTLTVAPPAGCTLVLSTLSVDVRASSTGPAEASVATSVDGFGAHTATFAGTSAGDVALSASAAGAIEVRVYGYGATGSAGTLRIQSTLTVSGALE